MEWKEVYIKDICTVLGDGLHGTPEYDEKGDFYFINGNNLQEGHITIKKDTKRVSQKEFLKYQKELNDRTILVSINGTIGNVAKYNNEPCILGKSACFFNVKEDIDRNFIYYVISSPHFKKSVIQQATGTTIKNVSLKQMRDYHFLIPVNLSDQRKIAGILSALDSKIENNNKINANLESQAQALFKSWFVDFTPFKDQPFVDSELGPIPQGWKVGKLGDIGEIVGGSTPSKSKPEYYTTHGIAWLTPKDLSTSKAKFTSRGEIDITDEGYNSTSTKLMPRGSVLFSSRAPIGYLTIAKNEICTNQGFKSLVPNGAGTGFIYYTLRHLTPQIENRATGSTFKEASATLMRSVETIVPPTSILNKFEELLRPILQFQEKKEEENQRLAALRDTLLPKLMSGEIKL